MSLTESERERAIDRMVMRRLATDREYLNAENADQQAEREAAITAECEAALNARYPYGEYHTGNRDDWPYNPY